VSAPAQSGVSSIPLWSTNLPELQVTAPFSSSPSSSIGYTPDPAFVSGLLHRLCRRLTHLFAFPLTVISVKMSAIASTLSGLARSKLHLAVGGGLKDNCSLHRWVLLKNSIVRSQSSSPVTTEPASLSADVQYVDTKHQHDEDVEECDIDEEDAFLFPDPDALLATPSSSKEDVTEAQWLDSLLETLSDNMGDDTNAEHRTPADEEDETFSSPSMSPTSSSEDLVNTPSYYQSSPIAVPYPIPYPPLFHPPLIMPQDLEYRLDRIDEVQTIEDGLPYYDVDELDDLSVPEAIEDTSDDESETLTTPFSHSTTSFGVDPASIPLPPDRRARPHVYVDTDDSYLYHLDPLPFAGDSHEYGSTVFQEC
jgi:hypothetical protein